MWCTIHWLLVQDQQGWQQLYAARSNLKVGIIEQGAPGGQMNNTFEIENYPGYDNISGPELSMKMYEPLEKFKVENIYGIVQK